MNQANVDIKALAKSKGIYMWQIAERYGLHEGNFSRKLRHPLSASDRDKIISIINKLADEEV